MSFLSSDVSEIAILGSYVMPDRRSSPAIAQADLCELVLSTDTDPTTHDKGGVLLLFSLAGDRVDDRLKLPNANVAVVDRTKVVEYLLNREHPDNGGKADFFIGMGFNAGNWDAFAAALRLLALSASVTSHHGIFTRHEVYCGWTDRERWC